MDQNKTGKLIKELRKRDGYTQKVLAEKLNITAKAISKWECGKGLPDIIMLKALSKVFHVTVDELLNGELKPKPSIRKKILYFVIVVVALLIIALIYYAINYYNSKKEVSTEYDCTVIRTYHVDKVSESNDESYLYITIYEFQVEGIYTMRTPRAIANTLESDKDYEFTFKTTKDYLTVNTYDLFHNSEITNVVETDKQGLDQTSVYYCGEEPTE